ncbi:cytochrome P450 3A30-like [Melanotaenia boesemani]|uniref:cytochrome P450 3A30-like n=1 Tax=Melanotaenia boesemani TaxID=1250792 RepID=UPI001C03B2ED|nr:cytochrome P450 3A30-like [Melanotaenia boesemani]
MSFFPFFSLETWILLISFICIFVLYGHWTYGVFEKLGIPGPKPVPYFGTIGRYNKVYFLDDAECAKRYGRVWGMYELRRPMLVVMDPDMLKTILVKECFTYFTNRRDFRLNGDLYDSVSLARDDHWRRLRNLISPSFSSGHIKEMFSIMKHHSRKLTDSLNPKAQNNEVISIKDFFGGYSLDVMGSSAFSVDLDTVNNPANPFASHASKLFRFPEALFLFQGFFPFFLPLLELLGFSFFSKSSTNFFKTVVEKIRAERSDSSKQNMGDLLQNFINSQTGNENSKEKQKKGLTDHEILSQVTMFVFAGYETSANTLVFLVYSLARNPEVMKRLQKEIDQTFPNKGLVQYEALMQMDYLSSVVDECLRLYPPVARLERIAKETVKINGLTIPKDVIVMIPVYALHRDPELWPEPEEFKPERFSKENKQSINPYTYLPFGIGPRNCLGMRFAQLMIKLAVVEVLQNYSFSVCEETEIPLKMDPASLLGPLNPVKLRVSMRSVNTTNKD